MNRSSSPCPRRLALALTLAAVLLAACASGYQQHAEGMRMVADGIVAAVVKPRAGAPAASTADGALPRAEAAPAAGSRRVPAPGGNAFEPLNWQPAPPAPPRQVSAPPPPPQPPPAPTAPPLPFVFVGMVERGADRPQAYLAKGEALLVVSVGDFIENRTYRVDALAATGVVLTYLPLGKQQTVNVPGGAP